MVPVAQTRSVRTRSWVSAVRSVPGLALGLAVSAVAGVDLDKRRKCRSIVKQILDYRAVAPR